MASVMGFKKIHAIEHPLWHFIYAMQLLLHDIYAFGHPLWHDIYALGHLDMRDTLYDKTSML